MGYSGTEGLRHRIGGLEKSDIFGNVSTEPLIMKKWWIIEMKKCKIGLKSS
jgi:hypothetical protein